MKCAAFLLLCLLTTALRADEPPGIRFFGGTWNEALVEAKRQNKPLFVDFYANWCPPCRRMATEAFPNPTVGEKFNAYFLNYQFNAELGEGPDVARRFGVASYPTALYFTPDGVMIHRSVGYAGVNALVHQADQILRLPAMRRSMANRNRLKADD